MWNVNDLERELKNLVSDGSVKEWRLSESEQQRKEFYLIQEKSGSEVQVGLDQDRMVNQSEIHAMVTVPSNEDGKHGVGQRKLFPKLDLKAQLEKLVDSAQVSQEKQWSLPEFSKRAKVKPELCYKGLQSNFDLTSEGILEDMNQAIASVDTGLFNSSEIFVTKTEGRSKTSTGFESEAAVSKIFSEVCFSCDRSHEESEEFLITAWNCHPEQFNYLQMCQDSSLFAEKSLGTVRPPSGEMAVLIHADVIAEIMHDSLSHLRSEAEYYQMPFLAEGSDFVKDFDGEAFEMSLDPGADYMLGSAKFGRFGVAQQEYSLVKNNKVTGNIRSPQFAQFMGKEQTPYLGNLKIETKGKPFEKLAGSAPKVLEILQFSGLFTSPLDLTFSSEIRLARLYDNETGTTQYIKGGSLSGNLMANLRNVQWSKEQSTAHVAEWGGGCKGYIGPKYAVLSDVTISS
jgi:predicted Zn-dependent protease